MKIKFFSLFIALLASLPALGADYKTDIYLNSEGTGDYPTIADALEASRAYMDYTVTIHLAPGTYKEKLVVPTWLTNIAFVGEGEKPEDTVITHDDHANINKMGTFRTYTVRVDGNDISFKNLTIENNAPQLGQAVALHTEGDRLKFENCRLLGNQDTVFTGGENKRLLFDNCYIEGTTDFIFGPATAYFKDCLIHSKRDSYITAASTPPNVAIGYVFENCKLTADPEIQKVYLGRPWRPYAYTMFINCDMDKHIRPERWNNWGKKDNELTARYGEYGSKGPGAEGECAWAKNPDAETVKAITDLKKVFGYSSEWNPAGK